MHNTVVGAAPSKLKDRVWLLSVIVMVILSVPLYLVRFLGGLEVGALSAALWFSSIAYGAFALVGFVILYLTRPDPSRGLAGLLPHLLLAIVLALAIIALSFLSGGGL
ncbi:hypothetical protein [Tessaracoccus antarcticus]|uniref:Uncharacterized protein n=1 Tax=Tessaracoccus antarcticus TaxID=2479848 RepID=A0A3M0FX38_9ACTN|nr:hypothetical protein [Tessaracoccus antarcticus]RMB57244.1 hypothetical protein EAX62_16005 [Tessaracoccus antarcticus]